MDSQKDTMFLQIRKKDDEDKYILGQLMCDAAESGDLYEVTCIFNKLRESHDVQDTDLKDIMTITPLANASKNGHLPVCKFLISAGADVNNAEKWSATPLALASYSNHLYICKLLVNSGADINLADQEGRTAMYWASIENNIEIMQLFQ